MQVEARTQRLTMGCAMNAGFPATVCQKRASHLMNKNWLSAGTLAACILLAAGPGAPAALAACILSAAGPAAAATCGGDFGTWLAGFRGEAIAAGIASGTLDAAL